MTEGPDSRSISSLWKNLKRALVSSPDVQNNSTVCLECGMGAINSSNFSNNTSGESVVVSERPLENNTETLMKRQRLNIATDKIGPSEETSFMEIMKNLLSCSICLEVNSYSNQCSNGHLICITCSGRLQQSPGDLNCPVCRISLKQGLHRSLLAEQLTSELPAACRYCDSIMPVKLVKKHETNECTKRMVPCKYKMFGCDWIGVDESCNDHVESCTISNKTVGILHDIVNENVSKDIQLLQIPLQLWRSIISKVKMQSVGSRMLIRQTTLNKSAGETFGQMLFKSPMIRVPFSCCNLHGFYLDIFVTKIDDTDNEKLQYILKSENRTKLTLNFYLASLKINETVNLDVQDALHSHHFESNHKESSLHEFKLLSLDCQKEIPKMSSCDSIFAEICFVTERERSEKGHGILSSNDEEESNPFMSSGSDSNVVFTLFSPTTSAARSMNTSNAMLSGNDETNNANEIEPSHEEDIVITVTDNIDSGDDISTENRDNYTMRNNHSFVAVPSVFINPATSLFTYSPFPIENSFMNNTFQQPPRINRENLLFEQPTQTNSQDNQQMPFLDQDHSRMQASNTNRNSSARINEPIVTPDINRVIREPIHMSLFYPPQTVLSPYVTNSMPPMAIRPSPSSRNILVRPRITLNPSVSRQLHILTNVDEINALNAFENAANDSSVTEVTVNHSLDDNVQLNIQNSNDQNYLSSFPYVLNQSVSLQDPILQDEIDNSNNQFN